MDFKHLNLEQRYQIGQRLQWGQSPDTIALALGVDRSTIYRERLRGSIAGVYHYWQAHCLAESRRAPSAANHPVKAPAVWKVVRYGLRHQWSPDEIGGRLTLTGGIAGESICGQAVYDWLERQASVLTGQLRHQGERQPPRTHRASLPADRLRIHQRPDSVARRRRCGHWEGDTIRGRSPLHCMATLVERKSLFTRISTPRRKQAVPVARAIVQLLKPHVARTLTLDNGSEFARFATITERLKTKVYFADPYRPQQRGRNEQQNKLIRQYIPKNADITQYTSRKVRWIEDRLNNRPRKSLGYRTPREVLYNLKPTPVAIRT